MGHGSRAGRLGGLWGRSLGIVSLAQKMAPFKLVRITLGAENGSSSRDVSLLPGVEITNRENNLLTLRVGRAEAPAVTAQLLQTMPVVDLTVEDPPIEAVIDQVYTEGGV